MMTNRLWMVSGVVLLLGSVACLETEPSVLDCEPFPAGACVCPNGLESTQICLRDGTYGEACWCDESWWTPAAPGGGPAAPDAGTTPGGPSEENSSSPPVSPDLDAGGTGGTDPLSPDTGGGEPLPDAGQRPDAGPPNDRYCYQEVWHDGADLGPARTLFERGDWQGAAKEALRIRWPAGAELVAQDDSMLRQFGERGSFSSLLESFGVIIHEGIHLYDYGNAIWDQNMAYYITESQTIKTQWIDGFNRSEIASMLPDDSTDLYRRTYLTGEQGERGFSELMDEQNCYIADMASTAVVGDAIQSAGWSGRDGAVAFLLYVQLFLRRARTQYPAVYSQLQSDETIRELVRLQWLRTHFWLEVSDRYPEQGIRDQTIRTHVYSAENLTEMESFLGHPVDASPCLPNGAPAQP